MEASISHPINILSIDGSSSGLEALYMLDVIFNQMKFDLDSPEDLKPCDFFDVIGGTGSGAVDALLLGKLRMSTSQAIEAYAKLVPTISPPHTQDKEERQRNSDALRKAFSQVIKDAGIELEELLEDKKSPKILAFALNVVSISTPYILRSYRTRTSNIPSCTILQAASASVASPSQFVPVTVGKGHRTLTLIDATCTYANPARQILREAKEIFGSNTQVATIVSVGAETRNNSESTDQEGEGDIKRVRGINDDCERVHEEMQHRLGEAGIYHRFKMQTTSNVSQKEPFGDISSLVQQDLIGPSVDSAIQSIRSRPVGPDLQEINTVTRVEVALKPRPSLVRNFVGREDILQALRQTHFNAPSCKGSGPIISVLVGLGGSGKTQIAVKFAAEYEDKYPTAAVYFVDGSEEVALTTDFETIIRSQGSQYRTSTKEDALLWLATKSQHWLLIIDNVDDPSLKLSSFVPRCSHGHIVITTRDATRKIFATESCHTVEGLAVSEAVGFLLEASSYKANATNQDYATQIVQELGHLPLALAHSAAYISIHQCLSTFLSTYRQRKAKLLQTSPDLPHDYRHSVATTIQMSLDRLPSRARDLIRLFAALDARSISYDVLVKAAERDFLHVEWTDDDERQTATVDIAKSLTSIFFESSEWMPVGFNEIIAVCLQYSLLRVAARREERFYSMHVLVQDYLQQSTSTIQDRAIPQLVVRLLGSAITSSRYGYDFFAFNRLLLPHIRLVDWEDVTEPGDHSGFAQVFREMGDVERAVVHMELCVEQWKQSRGEDDLKTLAAMTRLGNCYASLGYQEEALETRKHVLERRRKLVGDDDPDTITEMHNLAISYSRMGREADSIELKEIVLDKRRVLLGEDDRLTLDSMYNLGNSYATVGREEEALALLKDVTEKYTDVLGEDHRDTLNAMDNLANLYSAVGQEQEALDLGEKVLQKRKELLGDDHEDTLDAINNLAVSYSNMGREEEALELKETVLGKYKAILGHDHRHTIKGMTNLAISYYKLGRLQEALKLQREVLEKTITLFGKEDRDTLRAMYNLTFTYRELEMKSELEELLHMAIPPHEEILGPDDWHTQWLKKFEAWIRSKEHESEDKQSGSENLQSDLETSAADHVTSLDPRIESR